MAQPSIVATILKSFCFRLVIRMPALHPLRVSLRTSASGLKALIVLFFLIPGHGVAADTNKTVSVIGRPKVALVLSGGAARGSSHVGVLKVLEQNHIPVDFIAGTSMGAIVGGMYASGLSPEEMEHTLTSTDWNDLFTDRPA